MQPEQLYSVVALRLLLHDGPSWCNVLQASRLMALRREYDEIRAALKARMVDAEQQILVTVGRGGVGWGGVGYCGASWGGVRWVRRGRAEWGGVGYTCKVRENCERRPVRDDVGWGGMRRGEL